MGQFGERVHFFGAITGAVRRRASSDEAGEAVIKYTRHGSVLLRPTGVVVFLFSDIEGSTTRWEAHSDAMQSAIRFHDASMRAAMDAHGGYLFKTIGDAFCVAFSTPTSALAAALQAQRQIQQHDFSAIDGLHVRMALHAGEADERDGDYFGNAVNRVARLLSAAHGGQIVVSGVVADALVPTSDGISLRALGTFRLKDLREPERIFQIVARDLPTHFNPLRTLEAVPNNLPQQTSAFIGRESDIAGVRTLLRTSTLVTIAGPGGVGKTRLALQCAAEAIDRMNDGAWFVSFASIADPDLVATTVARALGLVGPADATHVILDHLASRELLLLLDNCEHLIGEVARVIDAVRARCPRVTILATSREDLHLEGERLYRLPPLEPSAALRLFVQLAQAANPQFELTDANAPVIEGLCGQLDGIPLAIELAAARTRVLSLNDLSSRLHERLRILTGGARTALPRQQTLRALIDWSHDLLTDAEKTLFRRICCFAGGFTLDAAIAICKGSALDEWAVLDALSSLVDKSLVIAGADHTHQRFRLLETIREYALERLNEAREALPVHGRHASFFEQTSAAMYAEWDLNPSSDCVKLLAPDLDNVRAALKWALADANDSALGAPLAADSAPLFIQLSLLTEGTAWCSRALAGSGEHQPGVRGRLEYVLSMILNNQGHYPQALGAAERAAALLRQSEDERGLVRALSQVAQQYSRAGRFDDAKPYAAEANERARATGDMHLFAGVARRCAFSLPPSEIEAARAQFADAVSILEHLGGNGEACQMLEWWAESEAAAACFERATEVGMRALQCSAQDYLRMHLTSNLTGYALAAGDFERAATTTQTALDLALEAKHALLTAIGIAHVAPVRARTNAPEAARLFGYACAQMAALNWTGIASDERARENIARDLVARVGNDALPTLLAEGAAWSEEDALSRLRV